MKRNLKAAFAAMPFFKDKQKNSLMRKFAGILCIGVFTILLSSCGASNNQTTAANPTPVPTQVQQNTPMPTTKPTNVPAHTASATAAPTAMPTPYVPQPIIQASYPIDECLTSFSNGSAFVRYEDNNTRKVGLIDKNGYLLYSEGWGDLIHSFGLDVRSLGDGLFRITPYNSYHSNENVIIDSSGKIIFDYRTAPEGYDYYYLGYGDGVLLFLLKQADLYSASKHIIEIDSNGNTVYDLLLDDDNDYITHKDVSRYAGNGLFNNYNDNVSYIYNTQVHSLFKVKVAGSIISYNDKMIWHDERQSESILYRIEQGDLEDADSFNSWCNDRANKVVLDYAGHVTISEGLILYDPYNDKNYSIYNFDGELISTSPSEWKISSVYEFSGGYAPIKITGADGNTYITIIDRDFNIQYEPKKMKITEPSSWHGYIYLDGTSVLSPTGEITSISEINSISNDYSIGWLTVSNGYSRKDGYFQGIDGSVIDTIYYVSNYDEIVSYGIDITPVPRNSPIPTDNATSAPRQYTMIPNFSIEGKWKNTGSYTFGQVQAGAIVVFNGANCNFVSPSDTYAFYLENDVYMLYCTTVGFSETLSFVVRIIDNDHIDVYNGSSYLELTRVG